jgi:hypothetical protein
MTSSQLPQEHYLQVEEVYQSFVEQIQKDALMANIHLSDHIFASPQLNAIIQSLTQVLKELLNSPQGMEKIQTWLYRVDVSEESIKKKLQQSTTDYATTAAELIVKRSLQKIVIRYLHKNNLL